MRCAGCAARRSRRRRRSSDAEVAGYWLQQQRIELHEVTTMWNGKNVSVVFPVYNEEEGLLDAINDFSTIEWVDEVVVVDNNSTDRSAEIAASTIARLVTESRQGYGYALRRGLQERRRPHCIGRAGPHIHGERPSQATCLRRRLRHGVGNAHHARVIWAEETWAIFLRLGNWVVAKLLEFLFNGPSLSDCGCTLRLVHAKHARRLHAHFTVGGSHFLREMVILGLLAGGRALSRRRSTIEAASALRRLPARSRPPGASAGE